METESRAWAFRHCGSCGAVLQRFGAQEVCPQCLLKRLDMPEDASTTLEVHIPGYHMIREIGRGGMGVVWRALHVQTGETVAVKLLLAGVWAEPRERARFIRESDAIRVLNHPGIVKLREAGEAGNQAFLVLDYVDGATLAETLDSGPMEPEAAVRLVRRLASALAHAHAQMVFHRDIKPGNVLLDRSGQPYLTDFGLARFGDQDSDLTQTREMLGTPAYAPPEHFDDRFTRSGVAADVYGLGAILYHCLAGRPPVVGRTAAEALRALSDAEPPPLRWLNPEVPESLEIVCLKCLRKDPRDRYASISDLDDDLRRSVEGEPIRARRIGVIRSAAFWVRRHRLASSLLVLILVLVLTSAGLALVQARHLETVNRELREREARQTAELVQTDLGQGDAVRAVSRLARQVREGHATGFAGRRLTSLLWERDWIIPGDNFGDESTSARSVAISDDGRWLVLLLGGQDGEWPRLLVWSFAERGREGAECYARWSADRGVVSRLWFLPGDQGLGLRYQDGSVRYHNLLGQPITDGSWVHPALEGKGVDQTSPDGRFRLIASGQRTLSSHLELRTGTDNRLLATFEGEEVLESGGWKATPHGMLFATLQGSTLRIRGEDDRVPRFPPWDAGGLIEDAAWMADGSGLVLAVVGKPAILVRLTPPARFHSFENTPIPIVGLSWSQDGRALAISRGGEVVEVRGLSEDGDWDFNRSNRISATFSAFAGNELVTGHADGKLRIRSNAFGADAWDFRDHMQGAITHLAVSADRAHVVVVESNAWIQSFSLPLGIKESDRLEISPGGHGWWAERRVYQLAINPRGDRVGAATSGGSAWVWKLPSVERVFGLEADAPFTCMGFDPTGRRVAAGHMNAAVLTASVPPTADGVVSLGHQNQVFDLAFTEDGLGLGTVGMDGRVRRWDPAEGELSLDRSLGTPLRSIAHHGPSRSFVVGAFDGSIRRLDDVWGWDSAEPLMFGQQVRMLKPSPDGRLVAVGGREGAVGWIRYASASRAPPPWLVDLADVVAGQRFTEQGTVRKLPPEEASASLRRLSSEIGEFGEWAPLIARFRPGTRR